MSGFQLEGFLSEISPMVLLVVGYAVFLLCIAGGLELLARSSHHRSQRLRTMGFTYHKHLDVWECSQGQHLLPTAVDYKLRLVRYRGNAHVCNSCPLKAACTDSHEGREIVHSLDPWPYSEIGRFHRGISLVLALLALIMLGVTVSFHHRLYELMVLGVTFAFITLVSLRLLVAFRGSPANFLDGASPHIYSPPGQQRLQFYQKVGVGETVEGPQGPHPSG
jgi:hypothetical protein